MDASVVLKWFHSAGEAHVDAARALRDRYEAGELRVLAPALLWLEIVNVAARAWRWRSSRLHQLAATLPNLGFDIVEVDVADVARWTSKGLTAYDAAYVAVAEQAGAPLITDDTQIVRSAPTVAVALGAAP